MHAKQVNSEKCSLILMCEWYLIGKKKECHCLYEQHICLFNLNIFYWFHVVEESNVGIVFLSA